MSLKKNVIANYIGQFYSLSIGIVILPFYLKYLGAEAYGLIGFFTMLQAWLALLDLGLSPTMMRETARLKSSKDGLIKLKQLLRSIELVFIIISIILIIFVLFFNNFIATKWLEINELPASEVEYIIILMGFMIAFKWIVSLYRGSVNGFEHQVWLNIFFIFINSLKFIGGFILVKYFSQDITHFFEYQLVVGVIEFIVIQQKLYRLFPKNNSMVLPSFDALKSTSAFAGGVAYTSVIWVIVTQIDKLLLSHFIPLKEYGYFSLVVLVSSAILQFSGPISQAIIPRMTSLLEEGKEAEMISLYFKATQFVAVVTFAVSATVAFFSEELLFSWTGDVEASQWGRYILLWYTLGNGILTVLSFQAYLQYAYGKLKYHVIGSTVFGIAQIIIMGISTYLGGALGASIAWFSLQLFFFIFWTAYIHKKFIPTLHMRWLKENIIPALLTTILVITVIKGINIHLLDLNRLILFLMLLLIGMIILFSNIIVSKDVRSIVLRLFKKVF